MKVLSIHDSEDHISQAAVDGSATTIIAQDSVLMVVRSGILSHSLPVAVNRIPVALNQDLKACTPAKGVDSDYLAWALRRFSQGILGACQKDGTTVASIEFERLKRFEIPVGPHSEQRRIVAKLEELFSELDAGVEALRRAQRRLTRYRQALLQAAVTGELTQEGRERRTHDIKPGKLGDLPEAWAMTSLGALSSDSSYGTSCKCSYENTGIAVLRIPNVQNGCLQFDDLKRAPDTAKFSSDDHLDIGDLLIIRTNGSRNLIGRAAVVTIPTPKPLTFASYLIRFRILGDASTARWTALALAAPSGRAWLEPKAATTAGQYNLSASKLADFPIHLPPQQEREAILAELDRRLSAVEAMETNIQPSLRRAERLRQSILERAFRGELVPQDPHDEPAEALMARLKAATPEAPATRRRGRPSKAEPVNPAESPTPRRRGRPRKQVTA
jgi:type I restriction enzyme S subunit